MTLYRDVSLISVAALIVLLEYVDKRMDERKTVGFVQKSSGFVHKRLSDVSVWKKVSKMSEIVEDEVIATSFNGSAVVNLMGGRQIYLEPNTTIILSTQTDSNNRKFLNIDLEGGVIDIVKKRDTVARGVSRPLVISMRDEKILVSKNAEVKIANTGKSEVEVRKGNLKKISAFTGLSTEIQSEEDQKKGGKTEYKESDVESTGSGELSGDTVWEDESPVIHNLESGSHYWIVSNLVKSKGEVSVSKTLYGENREVKYYIVSQGKSRILEKISLNNMATIDINRLYENGIVTFKKNVPVVSANLAVGRKLPGNDIVEVVGKPVKILISRFHELRSFKFIKITGLSIAPVPFKPEKNILVSLPEGKKLTGSEAVELTVHGVDNLIPLLGYLNNSGHFEIEKLYALPGEGVFYYHYFPEMVPTASEYRLKAFSSDAGPGKTANIWSGILTANLVFRGRRADLLDRSKLADRLWLQKYSESSDSSVFLLKDKNMVRVKARILRRFQGVVDLIFEKRYPVFTDKVDVMLFDSL